MIIYESTKGIHQFIQDHNEDPWLHASMPTHEAVVFICCVVD